MHAPRGGRELLCWSCLCGGRDPLPPPPDAQLPSLRDTAEEEEGETDRNNGERVCSFVLLRVTNGKELKPTYLAACESGRMPAPYMN